jgi:hypothetical protein
MHFANYDSEEEPKQISSLKEIVNTGAESEAPDESPFLQVYYLEGQRVYKK